MPLDGVALAHGSSASQTDTYWLCNRKWGFGKLDLIPRLPNKYADRGTAIHTMLEQWLTHGTPIDTSTDYGKMAEPGLKFLPAVGVGLKEHRFTMETEVGIYRGDWDIWIPHAGESLVGTDDPRGPILVPKTEVWDHKTTSDFKWLKTADDLRKDAQAGIYAVSAMQCVRQRQGLPDGVMPHVELNWVYYRASAKKPGARRVILHVLPDGMEEPQRPKGVRDKHFGVMRYGELEKHWERIESTTLELLDHHRQGRKGLDLAPNTEGCRAYGGCPYVGDPCKLTMRQLISGHLQQEKKVATLAERMKAAGSGEAPESETPAAGSAETPAAGANGAAPAGGDMAARMAAARGGGAAPAASQASDKANADAASIVDVGAAAVQAAAAEVNPPEAPAQKATEGATPGATPAPLLTPQELRLRMAGNIAAGLVTGLRTGIDQTEAHNIAAEALTIADAIIWQAAGGKASKD